MNRLQALLLIIFTAATLTALSGGACHPWVPAGSGGTLGYGGSISTGGVSATGGATPAAGAPAQTGGASTGGASGQTKCQLACANLDRLGCPEDQSTCVGQCEILTHDSRFTFDAECRINATTKAQAQACGIASCK